MARYTDVDTLMKLVPTEECVARMAIANAPPADVRENVHGSWIIDEDGNIECSVCGHHGVGGFYCERCGAKMDEGDKDERFN